MRGETYEADIYLRPEEDEDSLYQPASRATMDYNPVKRDSQMAAGLKTVTRARNLLHYSLA